MEKINTSKMFEVDMPGAKTLNISAALLLGLDIAFNNGNNMPIDSISKQALIKDNTSIFFVATCLVPAPCACDHLCQV